VNASFPQLDPAAGLRLGFELQMLAEAHVDGDRAGFSFILFR
jgi:hypothetical protein